MNIFKNLFSHRHKLLLAEPIITKDMISQDVINAIGSCYDVLCQQLNNAHSNYY